MNEVYHYPNSIRVELINNSLFLIKDETNGLIAIGDDPKKLLLDLINTKNISVKTSNLQSCPPNEIVLGSKKLIYRLALTFSITIIVILSLMQITAEFKKIEPIIGMFNNKNNDYSFSNFDNNFNIKEYFIDEDGNFKIKSLKILLLGLERLNNEYKNLPQEKKENLKNQISEFISNYETITGTRYTHRPDSPESSTQK